MATEATGANWLVIASPRAPPGPDASFEVFLRPQTTLDSAVADVETELRDLKARLEAEMGPVRHLQLLELKGPNLVQTNPDKLIRKMLMYKDDREMTFSNPIYENDCITIRLEYEATTDGRGTSTGGPSSAAPATAGQPDRRPSLEGGATLVAAEETVGEPEKGKKTRKPGNSLLNLDIRVKAPRYNAQAPDGKYIGVSREDKEQAGLVRWKAGYEYCVRDIMASGVCVGVGEHKVRSLLDAHMRSMNNQVRGAKVSQDTMHKRVAEAALWQETYGEHYKNNTVPDLPNIKKWGIQPDPVLRCSPRHAPKPPPAPTPSAAALPAPEAPMGASMGAFSAAAPAGLAKRKLPFDPPGPSKPNKRAEKDKSKAKGKAKGKPK